MQDEKLMAEIAPMREEIQRMREALEKIMAYQPKTGEKANTMAYSMGLIARKGLGLR